MWSSRPMTGFILAVLYLRRFIQIEGKIIFVYSLIFTFFDRPEDKHF
jgi:hypothetical protein